MSRVLKAPSILPTSTDQAVIAIPAFLPEFPDDFVMVLVCEFKVQVAQFKLQPFHPTNALPIV